MAITSKRDGKVLEVTHDGSTAWTWQDASHGWGAGCQYVRLYSINWIPTATDDVCCIRNRSTSGPIIFYAIAADAYDQRVEYYDGLDLQPVIDETLTATAGEIIVFTVK
jgi:hypothetical protein